MEEEGRSREVESKRMSVVMSKEKQEQVPTRFLLQSLLRPCPATSLATFLFLM
jgi:hypothetical protein